MYFEVRGKKTFCSNGTGSIEPGRPSVVFVHGAGQDHSTFVLAARYFARQEFNVYAVDLPGHGRSEGEVLGSIKGMADWLHDALEALGVTQTAIVGYSMGSLVCLQFAADYPDKVRSMALVGTSIPMPVSDPLLGAAKANSHDAFAMANTWSHSKRAQLGGNENPGISMMMAGQRLLEITNDGVFYADLEACNEFAFSLETAQKIKTDALVFIGDRDQMTVPVKAEQVAEAIPKCKTIRLASGHAMFSEHPNAVLDGLITIV
ncbi:MAG: alpha/beta hydrolase [Gammaproteobacteria bacterium]|nr:alpha/beta hydrolase [Gammaproteobacteria bacterium]